jgi:hypothetical protein
MILLAVEMNNIGVTLITVGRFHDAMELFRGSIKDNGNYILRINRRSCFVCEQTWEQATTGAAGMGTPGV